LEKLGDFPLNGMQTTHVQAFDSSPMVFFFGFQAANN
jgi:hypothetical protein